LDLCIRNRHRTNKRQVQTWQLIHQVLFLGISGTATQGTAGADNDVVYSGYWGAGVGTASITEAGFIFNIGNFSKYTYDIQ